MLMVYSFKNVRKMNIRYILGSIMAIPILPIMYFQGKKIKRDIPTLPEANGIEGQANINANKTLKILTIGESSIAGVGVETHDEGLTGTFARTLAQKMGANIEWKVYARSGYTAKQVTGEIIPKIVENDVDLIVIGLGANDAFTLNTPQKWRKQMSELIDKVQLQFKNTPIVFCNMPPIKEFPAFTPLLKFVVGNLGEILGEELQTIVAGKDNVYFYARKLTLKDWAERLNVKGKPLDFFSDGVHPSKLTYQTWGKDLANFLTANENFCQYMGLRLKAV
jgi:lysophospholipase L1-like esterase